MILEKRNMCIFHGAFTDWAVMQISFVHEFKIVQIKLA